MPKLQSGGSSKLADFDHQCDPAHSLGRTRVVCRTLRKTHRWKHQHIKIAATPFFIQPPCRTTLALLCKATFGFEAADNSSPLLRQATWSDLRKKFLTQLKNCAGGF